MKNLNDGYLYSRMQANQSEVPLGHQVGDMRVKLYYVACGDVNVMAQQIQNEDARFTFREWKSTNVYAQLGQDNGSI